ncbi:hypothetical protein Skr01_07330 [Sphaerisporangium krabiense]|uniref:SAM-dependent methyltransferase n=1 Tax=Sphaerisporangium krabiense TaxID=763782 RepID=A0A7W8ZD57_9ACTN|nr:class I SAM-dependent methyltransferase [Sphaerisporangium krabiense]MBB5631715.1 SAM-dependent methyltransferase [Sphaerisporangium krabiense]GII60648.1 hypothetical protein Skr01_07330 [Sphaerisporangium krabiense]
MSESETNPQQRAWSRGDLAKLAAHLPPIYAELLCEEADLRAGERVLDAAAGTGTVALAAARRFCDVVAVDFVPSPLEQAARLAACEDLPLVTHLADVQDLPYEDDAFDAVLSAFGAMFAPDQGRTAGELARVTRRGGRVGVTGWCMAGLIGDYARTIGKYLGSGTGHSPFAWGTEDRVRELFPDAQIRTAWRGQPFRYPSVEFAVDYFAEWYGPASAAFAALDDAGRRDLRADMIDVWHAHNRATDGTLVAIADYLETIVLIG